MKKYAFLTAFLLLCFMGTAVADEVDGLMEQLSNGNKSVSGAVDPCVMDSFDF